MIDLTTTRLEQMTERRELDALAGATGDLFLEIAGDASTGVTGLAYDSRKVERGDLFFCMPGTLRDGHSFAHEVATAGAAALVVERPTGAGIPEIRVRDARRAMGRIAAEFYGRPADDLLVLGVTGTNGKTTTAYLLESILERAGKHPGLVGTIETRFAGRTRPGVRTTPESVDLQALFAEMKDAGTGSVAMEVTSHALVLHRVEGIRFRAASFTNLTQDHLDFHSGMEDYFEAKRALFTPERSDAGAVNVDDPYGRKILESADVPCVSFGTAPDADIRATDVDVRPDGTTFVLRWEAGELPIASSLAGAFNVYNCLAAAATALQAGLSPDAIAGGIAGVAAVPGRFESIVKGQPFAVVVDYAHTPDSLDNVLRAARSLTREAHGHRGSVIAVFGCGGDRDRSKRPLMGAAAARMSDCVIVTSDNPRSEDPEAIIGEILEGVMAESADGPDAVFVDRREAIDHAIARAGAGDVVVIAGKGHETGQQFAERTVPFDDREVAGDALASAGWSGSR